MSQQEPENEPSAKKLRRSVTQDTNVDGKSKVGLSIEILGEDMLLLLFEHLSTKSVFRNQRVSKCWQKVFQKYCKRFRSLTNDCSLFPLLTVNQALNVAKQCPKLMSLDLSSCAPRRTKKDLKAYHTLLLKHMNLILKFCIEIKELNLSGLTVTAEALTKLKLLKNLEVLKVNKIQLPWAPTNGFNKNEPRSLTPFLTEVLKALQNLRELSFAGIDNYVGDVLSCLKAVNKERLESLDISHNTVNNPVIWNLMDAFNPTYPKPEFIDVFKAGFPVLKSLSISGISPEAEGPSGGPAPEFVGLFPSTLPQLETLDLAGCHLNECDMASLARLRLRSLTFAKVTTNKTAAGSAGDLNGEAVTKSLLSSISGDDSACKGSLDTLEYLDLTLCRIQDPSCFHMISQLRNLKELCLVSWLRRDDPDKPILDDHLLGIVVSGCTKLEKLTLRAYPKLTSAGLATIGSHCPFLTHLDIVSSTGMKNDGFKALAQGLLSSSLRPPNLKLKVFAAGLALNQSPRMLKSSWKMISVDNYEAPKLHESLGSYGDVPVNECWEWNREYTSVIPRSDSDSE